VEQVVSNLAEYGNTSAASIPLVLDEAVRAGTIKQGDTVRSWPVCYLLIVSARVTFPGAVPINLPGENSLQVSGRILGMWEFCAAQPALPSLGTLFNLYG